MWGSLVLLHTSSWPSVDQNLGLALYQAPVQGGHFQQVSALLKEYNIITNSSGCSGQTQNCREREMKAKAKAKVEGGQKKYQSRWALQFCKFTGGEEGDGRNCETTKQGNLKTQMNKMAAHLIMSKIDWKKEI